MEIINSWKTMTGIISNLTKLIYFVIAILLSLLALVSFAAVGLQFLALRGSSDFTGGLLQILHAVLLTLIIVEILETVAIYFRTSNVLVRPILVAGLTAMVRRVLLFGVEQMQPLDILVDAIIIAVLTAAVVVVGKEEFQG